MELRLTQDAIRAKTLEAKNRALLATIKIEVEPQLKELRDTQQLIDSIGSISGGFYFPGTDYKELEQGKHSIGGEYRMGALDGLAV